MSDLQSRNVFEYIASYYQGRALAYGMVGNVFMQMTCSSLSKYYAYLSNHFDVEIPFYTGSY